ncbi:TetR/AcrR family transcriptional regulator C-terminal domain-containing protein [Actinomadura keratinilytica]|uniref:TetR/AcrR family transcriptional regulator C-terminal domain-containing protein n=1 Tax=Actinomadura keratinilytica TaxID=547461 RepID=A0ABP7Y7W6_9ACTN
MPGTARDRSSPSAPVWARQRGGRRPRLTREAIVAAAIEIADAEGLEAVSIRRVAAALGVRPMSLYTHIERKEDLFDLMSDEVNREMIIEGELPSHWREAITLIARREHEVILRHPWVIDLVARHPRVGPNGLRHGEQNLCALSGLDVDLATAARIVTAVDHYMTGYVIRERLLRDQRPDHLAEPYIQQMINEGDFPHLRRAMREGVPQQESFEEGLRWLLDGIERSLGRG